VIDKLANLSKVSVAPWPTSRSDVIAMAVLTFGDEVYVILKYDM
jgi:hypothetical protein